MGNVSQETSKIIHKLFPGKQSQCISIAYATNQRLVWLCSTPHCQSMIDSVNETCFVTFPGKHK